MSIKFTTETGSTYLIRTPENTLTRITVESGSQLRRDDEPIKILQFLGMIEVGSPAEFLLDIRKDGILTHRTTSAVSSVEEI